MSAIKYISLQVNCGYARTNIYSNPRQTKGSCLARKGIDKEKRALSFWLQFSAIREYGIPDNYFDVNPLNKLSLFDKDCDKF